MPWWYFVFLHCSWRRELSQTESERLGQTCQTQEDHGRASAYICSDCFLLSSVCVTQLVCIVHSVGFFLNTDSTMHDGEVWKVIVKQRNWARDFLSRTCARECKGASKIIKACCKKRSGWRSDGSDGSGSGSFVSDLFPMHFYDADPPTKLLSFGVPAARL